MEKTWTRRINRKKYVIGETHLGTFNVYETVFEGKLLLIRSAYQTFNDALNSLPTNNQYKGRRN